MPARGAKKSTKSSPAGYSKRSLADKLGLKAGQRACFVAMPEDVRRAIAVPVDVEESKALRGTFDYLHAFVTSKKELASSIAKLARALEPDGMLWISWPKKSSGVACDLTEDGVRALALANDLVDVKVCAVDHVWSGLKLVVPVAKRPKG